MIADKIVEELIEALEDIKAQDIRVLDVQKMTAITDYMIVATGSSDRHVRAVAQAAAARAREIGHRPRGIEGEQEGEWVLVDLVDVVVHVMQSRTRALYQLERLWDQSLADEDAAENDKAADSSSAQAG